MMNFIVIINSVNDFDSGSVERSLNAEFRLGRKLTKSFLK